MSVRQHRTVELPPSHEAELKVSGPRNEIQETSFLQHSGLVLRFLSDAAHGLRALRWTLEILRSTILKNSSRMILNNSGEYPYLRPGGDWTARALKCCSHLRRRHKVSSRGQGKPKDFVLSTDLRRFSALSTDVRITRSVVSIFLFLL